MINSNVIAVRLIIGGGGNRVVERCFGSCDVRERIVFLQQPPSDWIDRRWRNAVSRKWSPCCRINGCGARNSVQKAFAHSCSGDIERNRETSRPACSFIVDEKERAI